MTDDTRSLHQRLHAVMERVDYIQKEKKAGMRYSIVSHDSVTAKVRPFLVEERVFYHPQAMHYSQNGNRTEVSMVVRFVSVDNASDFIDVPTLGFGIDDQDKGPGKAISYAVKYALLKALGLETGDDPDTEQNVVHKPAQARPEPRHDPETGEVYDEAEGNNMPVITGLKAFIASVTAQMHPNATDNEKAHAYAAAVIEKVEKYKANKRGEVWLEQFAQTHESAIARLPKGLQITVREAIAKKRAAINDPNFDPRDFEPIGIDPEADLVRKVAFVG